MEEGLFPPRTQVQPTLEDNLSRIQAAAEATQVDLLAEEGLHLLLNRPQAEEEEEAEVDHLAVHLDHLVHQDHQDHLVPLVRQTEEHLGPTRVRWMA